MSRTVRYMSTAALLSVMLLTFVGPVYAFDGRGGDRVVIGPNEIIDDDLYVGASEFVLDGTVNGDVVCAGQTLTINGVVEGNVIAAGQTVIVNGTVSGDVLAAANTIQFGEKARVGGDVVGAGYSLEFRDGGEISRDAILAAGQVLLAADVGRNVLAGSGALEIGGTVAGDVQAAVAEAGEVQVGPPPTVFMPQSSISIPVVPQGLTIDPGAKIMGDLEYTQNSELSFPSGVVAGTVTRMDQPEEYDRVKAEPTAAQRVGQWALKYLRLLVSLILVGLVLLWLAPHAAKAIGERLETKPWSSLGWGVIAMAGVGFLGLLIVLVTILAALILGVVTLGDLSALMVWIGLLVLFAAILGFVVAAAFGAKVVFGMTLGKWILRRANSPLAEQRYWPMVLGISIVVVVIALLSFPLLPGVGILGWLLNLIVVLFGLGAMWLWLRPLLQRKEAQSS